MTFPLWTTTTVKNPLFLSCLDLATCERLRSTYASRSIDNATIPFRSIPSLPRRTYIWTKLAGLDRERIKLNELKLEKDERVFAHDKG